MSGREWKPGDVLTGHINSTFRGRELFLVVEVTANSRAAWSDGLHAIDADGNGYAVRNIIDARPLVVIDPGDRDQVERLVRACPTDWGFGQDEAMLRECTEEVQAALRSLLEPPKPKPLLDRLKDRAPDGLIDPALAEQIVKEWLKDHAEVDS